MPAFRWPMDSILSVGRKTIHSKGLLSNFESSALQRLFAGSLPNFPACCLVVDAQCMRQIIQDERSQLSWEKTLDHLEQPGVSANVVTYAALLREFGNSQALSDVKRIHSHIVKSPHGQNAFLWSLLVQTYGHLGAVEDAYGMFTQINQKNVHSWNAMVGTKARNGEWEEAFQLFEQMWLEGVIPEPATFVTALSGCTGQRALTQGKWVHARLAGSEFEENVIVGTALINMYGKCGSEEDAQSSFDKMVYRDTVSWNAMIAVYAQKGRHKQAVELFCNMLLEGFIPNKVSFLSVLDACGSDTNLAFGKQLHVYIRHAGFELDVVVATSLISMYGKCGSPQNARLLFDKMPAQNVVSRNAMIAVYAQHEQGMESLQLFSQMHQEGIIPDNITLRTILSACTSQSTIAEGKYVHACIICNGFESDIIVATALLSMYGKCGSLADAQKLFDRIDKKDVVSWNAMIAVYAQNGHGKEALQLLNWMQEAGMVPDKITFINSLSACAGSSLEDAHRLFESLPEREVAVWNAMITVNIKHGFGRKALCLFEQMQWEGLIPDKATFLNVLSACSSQGSLIEGRRVHIHMIHNGYSSDVVLLTAVIHMYSKCGNLEEAHSMFEQMHNRDVISWNAMISAYSRHGHGKRALQIFEKMQQDGVNPDKITFIGILEACASEAAPTKGKHIHSCFMQSEFRLDAVIATALVNMYHKCNSLEDARSVFSTVLEHDVVLWTAMIAAYTEQDEGKEALLLFGQMQKERVQPDRAIYINLLTACICQAALMEGKLMHSDITLNALDSGVAVANALINMYGKCGSTEDAERVFDRLEERDVLSFNTMIAGYAQHGHGKQALQLLVQMQQGGLSPDQVTFASTLCACSHAGLVNDGHQCLVFMKEDHCITPTGEHYDCIVDLLGRAGRLDEAEELINRMPIQPSYVSWMTMLGACRKQMDIKRGEWVAWHLFEVDLENASPYVMLANLCSACGRADDAERIMSIMRGDCSSRQIATKLEVHECKLSADDELCAQNGFIDFASCLILQGAVETKDQFLQRLSKSTSTF